MCIIGLSESGHGGRFVPCEAYKKLQEENAALRQDRDRLAGVMGKADALEKLLARVSDCYEHEMSTVTVDKIDGSLGKYRKARHG